jgi:hypothetical protein
VTPTPDYFVAPFALDGKLVGVAGRSLSELLPLWLAFCRDLLAAHGPVFHCPIPLPPLQHITLQVTSGNGTALVSLGVHNQPATSAVALTGSDPAADSEGLRMYVDSMRRVPLVRQAAATPTPFETVFGLPQRPLYVVMPWANPHIGDADQQLAREFENHLAAALLARPAAV